LRRLQLCPAVLEHEKNLSEGKINGKYSKRKISAIHTAENSREKEIEAPLKNVQEGDSIITNPRREYLSDENPKQNSCGHGES